MPLFHSAWESWADLRDAAESKATRKFIEYIRDSDITEVRVTLGGWCVCGREGEPGSRSRVWQLCGQPVCIEAWPALALRPHPHPPQITKRLFKVPTPHW